MAIAPDPPLRDEKFLALQRRRLRDERAEQAHIVEALRAELESLLGARLAGEPSEDGFGRGGGESIDLDQARGRHEDAAARLTACDAALTRLDGGNYGRCEECGAMIARARLEVMPSATRCVQCEAGRPARAR